MVTVDVKATAKSRFIQELERRVQENKAYNENIFEHKNTFNNLEIIDGTIIVRLLKFEGEQDNEGSLLERKFSPFETEGGKPASKVDDWQYSMRAVVIKMPSQEYIDGLENKELKQRYNKLSPGTIVWPTPNALNNGMYNFIHERNYPVQELEGYLAIPVGSIQVIETDKKFTL